MKLDDLGQHPLFIQASQDSINVHKALGLKLTDDFEDSTALDERQFYMTRVGFSLAHTLRWAEQLQHAVHFMTDFGYGKKASEVGIKRSHHLLYNVENYLIRLQSVYDRCLQLTNSVFHLCMSSELVNHGVIVSNLHVERTNIPKLLKAVKKSIKSEEQERHTLIHKHSHMDPELRRIEMFYMHSKETWGDDIEMPFENLVYVRGQLVKKYTNRRKAEFDAMNAELGNALAGLFDGLMVEYARQKARLAKIV
jgi:Cthe_2314-like HEPN